MFYLKWREVGISGGLFRIQCQSITKMQVNLFGEFRKFRVVQASNSFINTTETG